MITMADYNCLSCISCMLGQKKICLISILSEFSKIKYRNRILEPGTTISGFVDNNKKKKKINPDKSPYCEAIYFEMPFNENNNLTMLLHNKNKN
jgi:hypothetical protein